MGNEQPSNLADQHLTSRLDPLLQGWRIHASRGDQDEPVNVRLGKASRHLLWEMRKIISIWGGSGTRIT